MDLKESIELENHKAELARRLMVETENFKSVILMGQSALKSAILINGGAAVALLAFIGHVWKPEYVTASINLVGSLRWFVIGVLLDAMAAGGTYAAQAIYASYHESREKTVFKTGLVLHVLIILLVAASYVMFFCGTSAISSALVNYRATAQHEPELQVLSPQFSTTPQNRLAR